MDDPQHENCKLCGSTMSPDDDIITLVRKDGVDNCNKFSKKRKLNLVFEVSFTTYILYKFKSAN